jgi:hypothetical protein
MTVKTISALFIAAAHLALAFSPTPKYTTNATQAASGYRVTFSHNCPATTAVFPHFTVTNGTACATQNTFDQPSSQGEVREYVLKYGAEGQSTWTFWIDNQANSTGPRVRSLVEATCISGLGQCYVDISNIDGVSNGFKVTMSAKTCSTIGPTSKASPNCAPLVCSVPSDWQCPMANRFDQDLSKNYPPTYLDALQSCVSNCTLYDSDEACCKHANGSEQTCTNQNLAIRDMCEDAYSYAYDDKRASYVYQLTLDEDTVIDITACP